MPESHLLYITEGKITIDGGPPCRNPWVEPKLIVIGDNKMHIAKLLTQMVLQPRIVALKWAELTKQTAPTSRLATQVST